jgi:hypothetical protein
MSTFLRMQKKEKEKMVKTIFLIGVILSLHTGNGIEYTTAMRLNLRIAGAIVG